MDQIRRQFLWGKSDGNGRGMSLVNWSTVCLPKHWGGLGVSNLEIRNIALLLRWWWKVWTEPNGLWTVVAKRLRGNTTQTQGPILWLAKGSFFWRQMIKIKSLFHWSACWSVGTGTSISFWYDSWDGLPLRGFKDRQPRPVQAAISLRDAIPILPALATSRAIYTQINFNQSDDVLWWRWSKDGNYTANSFYKAVSTGGLIKWRFKLIWSCYAPTTVKVFAFLMLKENVLTKDVLARRGMTTNLMCDLCNTGQIESAVHLLFQCPFAKLIWDGVAIRLGSPVMVSGDSVQEIWDKSELMIKRNGTLKQRQWATRFICTAWFIWKHRNEIIFRGRPSYSPRLVEKIMLEGELWLRFCRKDRLNIGLGEV